MFRLCPVASVARRQFCGATGRGLGTYKTSTGLVGLAVDPNGRENLFNLAQKVLQAVKGVPETSVYRINVDKIFTHISKTCQQLSDIKAIEDEIDLGQIEEVIEMAEDELKVVKFYIENRGWDIVAEEEARGDQLYEEMKDSILFSTPAAPEPELQKKA